MRFKLIFSFLFFSNFTYATISDSLLISAIASIEKEYTFEESSSLNLKNLGTIQFNSKFKFLNEEKSNDFVRNYWGNSSESPSYLGIILEKNKSIFDTSALLFTIYHLPNLLINAENIEVLKSNVLLERLISKSDSLKNYGKESVKVLNWVINPKYNKVTNCLFWAEELSSEINASKKQISSHFRFIGKDGVIAFDCISEPSSIGFLTKEIEQISAFFKFNDNLKYSSKTKKNNNYKNIEYLIIGSSLESNTFGAFIIKFWKAIFFIIGICGVILFFQFRPTNA
jgi:uncharacterized membrane-anchored protein